MGIRETTICRWKGTTENMFYTSCVGIDDLKDALEDSFDRFKNGELTINDLQSRMEELIEIADDILKEVESDIGHELKSYEREIDRLIEQINNN